MEPVLIGENAAQELRDAQAAILAAQKSINSIVMVLREALNLPDTWQAAQLQDGKLYLIDTAQPLKVEAEGD